MAFTFSQQTGSEPQASISGTINVPNITITGSTFTIPAHTASFTLGTYKSKTYPQAAFPSIRTGSGYNVQINGSGYDYQSFTYSTQVSQSAGWAYAYYTYNASASNSINTSSIFKSSNSTERTLPLAVSLYINYSNGISSGNVSGNATGTGTITLDVPPTATVSAISYDTGYVYANLTTASVTVSNSAAYYGGSVTSVAFTIGNQTVTTSGNGTLSIALNEGGVFTPTVTVTDSRGQTKVYSLDPITVNTYTAPSVSFDVARTTSAGVPDDEGTYGLIEAELTFSDVVATAQAPSVVLTADDSTQTTPTVTWYTSSALSTQVTWANVSSGDTVYGLFSGLSTQHSYQVSVRPRDSEGTGTAVTQTIAPAFYTIDFYAGGHGIAFGRPANSNGFYSAMTAEFEDTATFDDDVFISLPDYQTAGTTDKAIYDAIVALGWDSDVLS